MALQLDALHKERLARLLIEMQESLSLSNRAFGEFIGADYMSIQSYIKKTATPGKGNLIKIAKARGWTLEELEAHIEDRPVSQKYRLEEILQEVRALDPVQAAEVAKVAMNRAMEGVGKYHVNETEDSDRPKST
jgi:hypothetical protein